jgi:hypothetical protein
MSVSARMWFSRRFERILAPRVDYEVHAFAGERDRDRVLTPLMLRRRCLFCLTDPDP